jgi:hypothetical protein
MTTAGDRGPTGTGPAEQGAPQATQPTERSAQESTGSTVATERTANIPTQYSPTTADHPDVLPSTAPPLPGLRRDAVRWGPIWAGALITLATYLVLQLFFFAVGVLDFGIAGTRGAITSTVVSAVLGLIAFFVGGLVAGAAGLWTGRKEGLLQGVSMWALTVAGFVALHVVGGGELFGWAATVGSPAARAAAGWAALGLGLSVLVAALGGMVGSRMRPQGDRPDMPR